MKLKLLQSIAEAIASLRKSIQVAGAIEDCLHLKVTLHNLLELEKLVSNMKDETQ